MTYVDGFESFIWFSKIKDTAYGYEEVLAKHNKSVIESYDLVETDIELFITEHVNNLFVQEKQPVFVNQRCYYVKRRLHGADRFAGLRKPAL